MSYAIFVWLLCKFDELQSVCEGKLGAWGVENKP